MSAGGKPTEGGHFLLDKSEMDVLLIAEHQAKNWIRPFLMGEEFINNIPRWCLWLKDCPPDELRKMPLVMARVQKVREMRLSSKKVATQVLAASPSLFGEIRHAKSDRYLAIPKVSSERRRYIPIGYLPNEVIPGDKLFFIDDASLFTFGILTSSMHMAWMRQVCGRLKSDYSYSNTLVYNNYPWPTPTDAQKRAVETAAQAVLDARALFPTSTLADLYDPLTMPPALAKAHAALDRAVEKCYRPEPFTSDRERVEFLFALYEKLLAALSTTTKSTKRPPKNK